MTMIPEASVEAAAKGLSITTYDNWGDAPDHVQRRYLSDARAALESAAPHMLAGLRELLEDMERQPRTELATVPGIAAIIRATLGDLL